MKKLTYDDMAEILDSRIKMFGDRNYDEIVAVVRGGCTAAHYVAVQLRKKMGAFFPSSSDYETPRLILSKKSTKRILFVEDLVSKGRTLEEIKNYMSEHHPEMEWDFMPVFTDAGYSDNIQLCPLKIQEWVVMPWEKAENVKEGDLDLFRFK